MELNLSSSGLLDEGLEGITLEEEFLRMVEDLELKQAEMEEDGQQFRK